MATATMFSKQMTRLFGEGTLAGRPDTQLVDLFLRHRDEAAFAALVARHGAMVLGTCRAVLRDPDEAEDAFQATFLVLARKARSIRGSESLGGWLHRVAYRAAIQANRAASRRRAEERKAAAMRALTTVPAGMHDDLRTLIHAEIERLPEALRLPVVLCDLEGLSRQQAADELQWNEGTVRGRLARGRERLRARLVRRGVTPAAGALAAALARESAAAVPAAWAAAATRAAVANVATGPAAAILAERVIRAGLVGRLQALAALTLTAVAATWTTAALMAAGPGGHPPAPLMTDGPGMAAQPKAAVRDVGNRAGEDLTYSGRVIDPSGRPVAGAKLFLVADAWPEFAVSPRATTAPDGRFRFAVARGEFGKPVIAEYARVVASAEGFGIGTTDSDGGDAGRELTLRLVEDLPIEGRLADLEGRPVAGASVTPVYIRANAEGDLSAWLGGVKSGSEDPNELFRHLPIFISLTRRPTELIAGSTTDGQGRFRLRGIGRERLVHLRFESPAIRTSMAFVMTRRGEAIDSLPFPSFPSFGTETFHAASPTIIAPPSRPLEGVVRDRDDGTPVVGVVIRSYRLADKNTGNNNLIEARSDEKGRYRIFGMPRGSGNELLVTSTDRKHLPSLVRVADAPGLGPISRDIELTRAVPVEGRVIDAKNGKPVSAWVGYHARADNPGLDQASGLRQLGYLPYWARVETAADGSFTLAALPGRGAISVETQTREYPAIDDGMFGNSGGFIPVLPSFLQEIREIDVALEARGRREEIKIDPGRTVEGTVLDPDGKPLAGSYAYGLENIGFWTEKPLEKPTFRVSALRPQPPIDVASLRRPGTTAEKMLRLIPRGRRTVVFQHTGRKLAGWANVSGDETEPLRVRLEPWGVVEGRAVDAAGKALPGLPLEIEIVDSVRAGGGMVSHRPEKVRTGDDGRFRLEGLTPGLSYNVFPRRMAKQTSRSRSTVGPIKPGETRQAGDFKVIYDTQVE
jgi:RNA polymerase sigma factor (sigma-70 family)